MSQDHQDGRGADQKRLLPEVLPAPENAAADTPRSRVMSRMRRLVAQGAAAGGIAMCMSCVACDPAPDWEWYGRDFALPPEDEAVPREDLARRRPDLSTEPDLSADLPDGGASDGGAPPDGGDGG